MKALVVVLALALGGCANIQKSIDLAMTPVTVTPQMVQDVQETLRLASVGLVTYRRLCLRKVIDPVTRACRGHIEAIQPYTKAAASAINGLRVAIASNDQFTAVRLWTETTAIIRTIQNEKALRGVQ